MDYSKFDDIELIRLYRKGDKISQDILMTKYKNLVKIISRTYFLLGGDRDDLTQEGMIGLFKALNEFDETKGVEFENYARVLINNQIISAIKKANRQKHIPLNTYLSLDLNLSQDTEKTFIDLLQSKKMNPEDIIISREEYDRIKKKVKDSLSDYEKEVLVLYLDGRNYKEIGEILNKDEKSIDNAIQRIRKKSRDILKEERKNLGIE